MPPDPHPRSQRIAVLEAALTLLRDGGTLSLESAARAAGVSKPGLMYHFPSKQALLLALVDHVIDACERDLARLAPGPAEASATDRIRTYARWAITHEHDGAELVMFSDPRLRATVTARWTERFRPWTEIPAGLPAPARTRLHAVRLMADGCWFADAADVLPVPTDDRDDLLALALSLLEGVDA